MSDDEAVAIVDYAAALANANRAARITVPGVDDDGRVADYEVLVGPASQILVEPVPGDDGTPDAAELIAELERRTRELTWRPSQAGGLIDDYDL